ncbi:MAG: LacI family DNA-binding transcriptional regulator [Bacilli bacterium]|jgi:LacI family transcriptional regulator
MEKKKVTIYSIAETIGITPTAVSYVINGKYHKVSEATREKVLAEIKRTGYVPDATARNLSRGKSRLVGLFLPTLKEDNSHSFMLENPFYMEFIAAIEKFNRDSGYDLVLGCKNQDDFIRWALSRNFDAVILLGKFPSEEAFKIEQLHMPLIFIDVYASEFKKHLNIRSNDRLGTYLATKHLIELGHKKIGFVGSESRSQLDNERYLGYVEALEEAGIKETITYTCYPNFAGGFDVANKIIEDDRVTAVVCTADIIAIGVISAYEQRGKKVPENLSVVGFDDLRTATYVFPPLTTIRQHIDKKAEIVMDLLKKQLNNIEVKENLVVIEPELIIRNSTKPYTNE